MKWLFLPPCLRDVNIETQLKPISRTGPDAVYEGRVKMIVATLTNVVII